ncbi:MAG: glucoamylase family protein [Alsobacter sp.]
MTRDPLRTTDRLLDLVQSQTLRYFTDFAHPACAMALDRTIPGEYGPDAVAVGGSGFGIMALLVGAERGWISRAYLVGRMETILAFLEAADRFHGAFPHFLDGASGRAIPFDALDDGGDLVETAFLMAGLLAARQYLSRPTTEERRIRERIDALWRAVEWSWYCAGTSDTLYWHWSPRVAFARDFPIRGWNECLVTYVLAAGSPTWPIGRQTYERCWIDSPTFRNGRDFYGITLPLGPDFGGAMCFAHYSFLGIDPRGLVDSHADYFQQNVRHASIQREHSIRNPGGYKGYGAECWGLTASDDDRGYHQHAPDNDIGIISPTAALASFPYVPDAATQALETSMGRLKDRLWTPCGLRDAFCEERNWFAPASLAIDQGPIVGMIENHRSGLLWELGMSCPEIRTGLARLGFSWPGAAGAT